RRYSRRCASARNPSRITPTRGRKASNQSSASSLCLKQRGLVSAHRPAAEIGRKRVWRDGGTGRWRDGEGDVMVSLPLHLSVSPSFPHSLFGSPPNGRGGHLHTGSPETIPRFRAPRSLNQFLPVSREWIEWGGDRKGSLAISEADFDQRLTY